MVEYKIAPQREYATLEDFVKEQNNLYLHFLDDCFVGNKVYRLKTHFKRFQEQYPEIEGKTTRATVQSVRSESTQELPYERLWEAYKIMSKLVFIADKYVMRDGKIDDWFICR